MPSLRAHLERESLGGSLKTQLNSRLSQGASTVRMTWRVLTGSQQEQKGRDEEQDQSQDQEHNQEDDQE